MLLKNFLWDYSSRLTTIILNLVITGVLSRILSPDDYGLMGLVMAVTAVASIFQDFGFSSAIVQKNDINNEQMSTIFFLNWGAGMLLFILILLMSPIVAQYYNQSNLVSILQVSAITFLINPINLVPAALIQKQMLFKQQAIRNVVVSIIIGTIAIGMAYYGWGVWSLVFQGVLGAIAGLIINLIITQWHPKLYFNITGIKSIFSYSSYLFLSGLLNSIFTKIDVFLIGKVFSMATLGQYTRAQGMDNMVRNISSNSLLSVLFPYFSKIQGDTQLLTKQWEKYFDLICFAYFLLSGISIISAKLVFTLLFGAQWGIAADYFKIIAITGAIYPLSALTLSIIQARGDSKSFFYAEVAKKIVMLPCFGVAYYYGIFAFLYILCLAYFLMFTLNLYFLSKSIPFSIAKSALNFVKYLFVAVLFFLIPGLIDYSFWLDSTHIGIVSIVNLLFVTYFWLFMRWMKPDMSLYILQIATKTIKRP